MEENNLESNYDEVSSGSFNEDVNYSNNVGDNDSNDETDVDPGQLNSLTIEDLNLSEMVFIGMTVCGTGLLIAIGVLTCIRILRNV